MDYIALIGYIVSVIGTFGGWLLGRHLRKSTAIDTLMHTIEDLSKQVSEYQSRIIELQNEIILVRRQNTELQTEINEVRKENAELKEGQELMTRKIEELKDGQRRMTPPGPHTMIK